MEPAAAVEDGSAASASVAAPSQPVPTIQQPQPPPQQKEEEPPGLLSRLNDLLNEDYVYDIAYYGFWAGFWLFIPYVVLIGLAGMALYDACTAKVSYRSTLLAFLPPDPNEPPIKTKQKTKTPHRATANPVAPSSSRVATPASARRWRGRWPSRAGPSTQPA
jgi:hypothetical protein